MKSCRRETFITQCGENGSTGYSSTGSKDGGTGGKGGDCDPSQALNVINITRLIKSCLLKCQTYFLPADLEPVPG
jgi:hypothetical protein